MGVSKRINTLDMKILIAGCGDIGTKVGRQLCANGHQVYGLKRNSQTIAKEIIPIQADLSQPLAAGCLPDELDQVIYILSASGFSEQAYQQAYVTGVSHLVQALGASIERLQRFIFVSSTSVYSQNAGEWVDEASITEPRAFNGRIMLEAEQQVLSLPHSVVVRFSGIYGAGRNRMLNQVLNGQLAAKQPLIYSNRIHSDDCAGVLQHLSEMKTIKDNIVLASDHQPAALHDIHEWLADQLGVSDELRRYEVPARRAGSKRINNERLLDLGYTFTYPDYQRGYGELIKSHNRVY